MKTRYCMKKSKQNSSSGFRLWKYFSHIDRISLTKDWSLLDKQSWWKCRVAFLMVDPQLQLETISSIEWHLQDSRKCCLFLQSYVFKFWSQDENITCFVIITLCISLVNSLFACLFVSGLILLFRFPI